MTAHASDPEVAALTLEEKVQLLTGRDFWNTWPVEKTGQPTLPELAGLLTDDKPLDRTTTNSWEDTEFVDGLVDPGQPRDYLAARRCPASGYGLQGELVC